MSVKTRIFEVIEKANQGDTASQVFDFSIIILIVLNVLAVILGSFDSLPQSVVLFLQGFETVSVAIFTVEYTLRVYTAKLLRKGSRHPYVRYVFSVIALIDLLAILPFYLPLLFPFDLRFLRILRLLKLSRIFKLNRYNKAIDMIGRVLKNEKEKLLTTIFITAILLILASSIMYYAENEAQPDKFPDIVSSVWWAVATLTTVGYGDVYPVTSIGKLISGIIAMLGIGLVALPTGIISSGFISEVDTKRTKKTIRCPHCGKEIT